MNWPVVAFGDLFDISSSKRVLQRDWKTEGVPFYRAREIVKLARDGSVENELFISERHYSELKNENGVPKKNDLMISAVGTLGACYIVRENDKFYYKDASVLRFSPKTQLHARYFFHAFRTSEILDQVNAGGGSTVGTYTIERARKTKIALPSLEEQKRIALLLDTADSVLRLREQAIAKLDNLISSLFNELFGDKTCWPIKKLEEVAKTSSGGTPKRDVAEYYKGDIFWVKSGELNCDLITATEECISVSGLKNSSAKIMPKGTVLLAMYGATVGASSLLGVPASTNQAVCCISVDESILTPEYLLYFLRANKRKIIGMAVGGAQPNINQNIVKGLSIPLPPIETQHEFVEYASQIKKQIDLQRSSNHKLVLLQRSLQHESFAVN